MLVCKHHWFLGLCTLSHLFPLGLASYGQHPSYQRELYRKEDGMEPVTAAQFTGQPDMTVTRAKRQVEDNANVCTLPTLKLIFQINTQDGWHSYMWCIPMANSQDTDLYIRSDIVGVNINKLYCSIISFPNTATLYLIMNYLHQPSYLSIQECYNVEMENH